MCVCGGLCGSHENWCRDTCGSVATGGGVPPLLLDDDSLVVAGVFRGLRCLFVLLPLPLRVSRDAHARLVGLPEGPGAGVKRSSSLFITF